MPSNWEAAGLEIVILERHRHRRNLARPATGFAFYDPAHAPISIEMNDIKKGVDEIAAGGADASRSRLARST